MPDEANTRRKAEGKEAATTGKIQISGNGSTVKNRLYPGNKTLLHEKTFGMEITRMIRKGAFYPIIILRALRKALYRKRSTRCCCPILTMG
jgi:hypothetical protein